MQNETLKQGTRKISPWGGNASENDGNPSGRGASMPSPGGHLPTPPARRVRRRRPFFRLDTEGCCVGRAWRGRVAAGRPVAAGRAGAPAGHTETVIVLTIQTPPPPLLLRHRTSTSISFLEYECTSNTYVECRESLLLSVESHFRT